MCSYALSFLCPQSPSRTASLTLVLVCARCFATRRPPRPCHPTGRRRAHLSPFQCTASLLLIKAQRIFEDLASDPALRGAFFRLHLTHDRRPSPSHIFLTTWFLRKFSLSLVLPQPYEISPDAFSLFCHTCRTAFPQNLHFILIYPSCCCLEIPRLLS